MMDQAQSLRDMMKQKRRDNDGNGVFDKDVRIYTVASGKGGVGKSNFAVNAAIELQNRGKQVLVIDADIGMANVDILIGIFPKATLYDVLFNGKTLQDVIVEGPAGVKIIPGGSGILKMTEMDSRQIAKLAEGFLQLDDVEVIIIDTGAGISKNLMSFVTFSRETIIVTTPEPTAMTDAYGVIKTIAEIGLKKSVKIVVNKAATQNIATSTFERLGETVHSFLDIRVEDLGYILDDLRVSNAVMERKPFLLQYPDSVASKCIRQIVDKMLEEQKGKATKITTMSEVYNRLIKVFG